MPETTEHDAAVRRFFPPGVPLATILLGVGLEWLWPLAPGFALAAPTRYWIGGATLLIGLAVLIVWPFLLFRRSGQDPEPWKPTPEILEGGQCQRKLA